MTAPEEPSSIRRIREKVEAKRRRDEDENERRRRRGEPERDPQPSAIGSQAAIETLEEALLEVWDRTLE